MEENQSKINLLYFESKELEKKIRTNIREISDLNNKITLENETKVIKISKQEKQQCVIQLGNNILKFSIKINRNQ